MFLDRPKVLKRVDKKKIVVLRKTGTFTRQDVKKLLGKKGKKKKRRKKGQTQSQAGVEIVSSEPGEPPRKITGLLRDKVFFGLDTTTDTVVIGPQKLGGSRVTEILEFGGRERVALPGGEKVLANYAARPYLGPSQPGAIEKMREFLESVPL